MKFLKLNLLLLILVVLVSCEKETNIKSLDLKEEIQFQNNKDFKVNNNTLIWRGWEHNWVDHPHRVGRFGNWIEEESDGAYSLNHSSASGLDQDQATHATHYSSMKFTGSEKRGQLSFDLRGVQNEYITFEEVITIPFIKEGPGTVFMDGFDLHKEGKTMKLKALNIEITNIDFSNNEVTFTIVGQLNMVCGSIECPQGLFAPRVEYELSVFYQVIAGDFESINAHGQVGRSYEYKQPLFSGYTDTYDEIIHDPLFPPNESDQEANFVIGIRGFNFFVQGQQGLNLANKTPHLYEWDQWLDSDLGLNCFGSTYFRTKFDLFNPPPGEGTCNLSILPVSIMGDNIEVVDCKWEQTSSFPSNDININPVVSHEGIISIGEENDPSCLYTPGSGNDPCDGIICPPEHRCIGGDCIPM